MSEKPKRDNSLKKFIAMILAVVLCVSVLTVGAYAENARGCGRLDGVCENRAGCTGCGQGSGSGHGMTYGKN